jgi:hypothetical protein
VIQCIKEERRVIAWDPEDQLWRDAKMKRVDTMAGLLLALSFAGHRGIRVAYVPKAVTQDVHSLWASVVLWWARETGPCVCVAEELADVSSPGKASQGWGQLVRRGLKRGATIYAISQRWAEADKTVVGNAGRYVIFRQARRQDVDYMARMVDVPADEIASLDRLEYVEFDGLSRTWERKKIVF